MENLTKLVALLIAVLSIAGIAVGRFPKLKMNRATIALVGAVLIVLTGIMQLDDAWLLIDWDTIALLLAIMILNANFRFSGFFDLVNSHISKKVHTPNGLLIVLVFLSGFLSAFFLNDTIVLVFTPLVVITVLNLKRNPIPYLVALATSANIGSAATLIGNPQNILIGATSQYPFGHFFLRMLPVSLLGLGIVWFFVRILYPAEFKTPLKVVLPEKPPKIHKPLLLKCALAALMMVMALFAGVKPTLAALGAATIVLITRRIKPARVFAEIDWSLIVFFAGLFVITGSLEKFGFTEQMAGALGDLQNGGLGRLAVASAVLSNLISNVPAVLLLRPLVAALEKPEYAWLILSMATTFAGNLTLLGSVANLIVAELAGRAGVELSFREYLKAGVPITILSIAVGFGIIRIYSLVGI
ncbi:MAG: anion transporter [Calditrichia bacterium]